MNRDEPFPIPPQGDDDPPWEESRGSAPRRTTAQIQSDVDEELRFHLEMRAAALEASGMEPPAAREEALRRLGDVVGTRRACVESDRGRERSMQRREYFGEIAHDLTHGVRQLRTRPLFAIAAVATLAIGIGATTAIFGAADHVLLRPLPYRDIDRVVTLWEVDRATRDGNKEASPGNFLDWKKRCTSFQSMGLVEPSGVDITGEGPPEPVSTWAVSEGFFESIGIAPILGRTFTPEEHRPGGPLSVLISEGLWQRRYAANPSIVGRTIQIEDRAVTIVGVLPHRLEYPERKDIWEPKRFREDELTDRRSSYMPVVARLRPGVSLAAAQADLARVAGHLSSEFPRTNATVGIIAIPLADQVLGPVRPALLVLLGAVTLLLFVACANVAGLLLARGAERESELAVRSALGASHRRLIRQLLTESLLLAGLGGAIGLPLAWWGTRMLVALSPPGLPRVDAIAIDGRVLAFALAVTIGSALTFGLIPALRFSRPDLLGALGSGGRTTAGRLRARLRSGLVVAEIALALVLLTGAGLLIKSFAELVSNDVGFATRGRVSVQLFLWDGNPAPAQRLQRMDDIAAKFRELPGVEDVGVVSALPFHPSQIDAQGALRVEDRLPSADGIEPQIRTTIASPEYFRVMGVPLLRGRPFEAHDRMNAPRVALISQTAARRFFPGEDPIGKRVTFGVMAAPETREIVGITGDVRPTTLDSEPRPEAFIPMAQSGDGSVTFVVRSRGDAEALVPLLRKKVWEVDPNQSVYHAATVESLVSNTLMERRFHLLLFGVFSFIALGLACIGVYGLISMTTNQRSHEIGVRIALGARPGDIVRLIVGQGLRLIAPGVVIGVGGALVLTRFLENMLYRVRSTDPALFAQVVVVMVLVAVLGALLPALRAALTDPVQALKQE